MLMSVFNKKADLSNFFNFKTITIVVWDLKVLNLLLKMQGLVQNIHRLVMIEK